MKRTIKPIQILLAVMIVAGFAFQGVAYAGSACKGLTKAKCGDASSCAWIKGYTKKDGTKVKGHCKVAAAACKGMSKTACIDNKSCAWVNPFKKKDGTKVKGHCKASKPKKAKAKGKKKKK